MAEHAVVIAGGGPTGLMLAGELALAGVDVVIVERRVNQDLAGQRAGGLLARTIEILDQRGIAARKHEITMFAGCGEPGLEARSGGQRDIAGQSPRYLPGRASPGCRARAAHHDGSSHTAPARRAHEGAARHDDRAPRHGRAAPTHRGADVRSRHYASTRCCTRRGRCCSTSASGNAFDITAWADRVQSIDADYTGAWELPALGAVAAPTAVLIRPDGHVAWVGERKPLGLVEALTAWFGPPRK